MTNPLVSAFWSASQPPTPRHRHYRDAAILDDPDWAGCQCEIRTTRIGIEEIGLPSTGGMMEERGTLHCTECPDYDPRGCSPATPERLAAFQAHLARLKANNLAAREDRKRALRHAEPDWDAKWCSICGARINDSGARGLCARHYSEWKRERQEEAA